MNSTILNKFKLLPIVIVSTVLLLAACSQKENKASNQQPDVKTSSAQTSIKESTEQVVRTDEIFDNKKYANQFTVRFFSIDATKKSGDSMLIQTPDGVTMLIDSGLEECGPQVANYLKKLGIKKLDYIVASHLHVDHIGGFPSIISSFEVAKALIPDFPYNSGPNKRFQESLTAKNINTEFLREGDTFQLGKEVKVEILNPEPTIVVPPSIVPENSESFVNDRSIVMRITYKQRSFLFVGDIYQTRERQLVENMKEKLDVDVLKAPHHGADTSSSLAFINSVSPKYTIFTVNQFQSKDVYDKYRKADSNAYVTGVDGNILLISDGDNISVITEKNRKGTFLN